MSTSCKNCGESVSQNYCPACGQAVEVQRGPLVQLVGDFVSELFSLDGRHLRTAIQLLVPGSLTQSYLDGKRVSYVSPVRVYIVASLLFFLSVGSPRPDASKFNVWVDDVVIGRDEPNPDLGNFRLSFTGDDSPLGFLLSSNFEAKRQKLRALSPQEFLNSFFSHLESTVPTTLILFVPILAFALKLLYIKHPFFYVDHIVFSLHFQGAVFIALVLGRLVNIVGPTELLPDIFSYLAVVLFVAPAYLLLALKRVYQQTWQGTIVKTMALLFLYLLLIQPILVITVALVIRAM